MKMVCGNLSLLRNIHEKEKFFRFWSIGNRKKWNPMGRSQNQGMKPHTNNSIECWIYLQCTFDRPGSMIGLSRHDSFKKNRIIL